MIIQRSDNEILEIELGEATTATTQYGLKERAQRVSRCTYTDRRTNKSINLLELLPTNSTMLCGTGEMMTANPLTNEVVINLKNFQAGHMLNILHEIGHIHLFVRWKQQGIDLATIPRSQEERGAWGWALVALREQREQGIDLEPTMTRKQIKERVKDALLSYEFQIAERAQYADTTAEPKFWPPLTPQDIDDFFREHRSFFDDIEDQEATKVLHRTFFDRRLL